MTRALSNLLLHSTSTSFVLQPVGADAGEKCLVIDREDGKVSFQAWSPDMSSPSPRKVHGILGLPKLLLSSHLVVVTAREQAGQLRGSPIWRVAATEILPLKAANSFPQASPEEVAAERNFARLLATGVREAQLYFCYQQDITQAAQAAQADAPAPTSTSGHGCAEPRFLWNAHVAGPLWTAGASRFTLPVVCGFVGSAVIDAGRAAGTEITLIARTDCSRVGPRLWCRGADAEGSVANWVETEQIIRVPTAEASFLQVDLLRQVGREGRLSAAYASAALAAGASAPPSANEDDGAAGREGQISASAASGNADAAGDAQKRPGAAAGPRERGKSGTAAAGGPASRPSGKLSGRLFHTQFDFSAECPHGRMHKLAKLFSQLEPFLEESGFFLRSIVDASNSAPNGAAAPPFGSPLRGAPATPLPAGTPAKRRAEPSDGAAGGQQSRLARAQTGVVRTNCLDCLDRTNIVQTLLGERLLARQLSAMGVLPKRSASLADTPEAQAALQALWKAHGDAISRNYAGTGALRKSSLRRRLLLDPAISLARYYLNNHGDGLRADAAAFVSGAHVPCAGTISLFPEGVLGNVVSRARRLPSIQDALLLRFFRS